MDKNNVIKYAQPKWCTYPEANKPVWGCWSLLEGKVVDENFCRTCECHEHYKVYENFFNKIWIKRCLDDKKETKEKLINAFSDENIEKIAEEAYPINAVKTGTDLEDTNDDARYYYLEGLKKLREVLLETL